MQPFLVFEVRVLPTFATTSTNDFFAGRTRHCPEQPDRNPPRQMRRPLPVSHLHRSHRHVLVVSPDPSRCRVARSSDGQERAATGRFV